MALILIDNPPTTPTLTSQWTDFVNRSNANMIGHGLDLAIFTLSNWDGGTAKPQVEKGSIIEVGGSFYQADSDTALTDDSGLADGTVHIKMVVSGSAVIPTITNDSLPSWDSEQGGWYSSGERFLPHEMTRGSSGTTFINKFEYKFLQSAIVKLFANGAVYFPGAGEFGGTGTFGGGLSVGGNVGITGAITSVTSVAASGNISGNNASLAGSITSVTDITASGDVTCDDLVNNTVSTGRTTTGGLLLTNTSSEQVLNLSAGQLYILPAGTYYIANPAINNIPLQVLLQGTWFTVWSVSITPSITATTITSDGVNVRLNNTTGVSQNIYLRRFI